ncbi:GTPase Era [Thermoanaerobacterium thermosaccharolyticum]|jgi:GTPase|uniref:GTPase Era n=1 Tax=Thermoanaerobacterium thermosaccharolyticum TaxID=1517 RepID=A0A223HVB5_THETR|nr:GTPase Era [Thermoanaerobacterium thermosaccharolyticum]AST56307.1 GTPase Era [Thermoanaerobacterium thermosaccharolyticum]MCP2240596.1 GTP-binding protein Era [Thermoanaerobacterium thermosaccharolyticum]PHO08341.1 GTPase Era [Thermoanaerobacterium thermosaccharolyticum]
MTFKSGFAALIGRTNVGKSTLLNALLEEKVAITSDKPQTTRNTIQGILTGEDYQVVFIDTPGIHKPKHKLSEIMIESVKKTLTEVDLIIYMVEPDAEVGPGDKYIIEHLISIDTPVILVINKIDTVPHETVDKTIENFKAQYNFKDILPISALKNKNIDLLKHTIVSYMPEGPQYFPSDYITDRPEKFLVSEIIREKILNYLEDEVPHGVYVEVNSMKVRENKDILDIEAFIFCEKESHKAIIIGKNGQMLRKIGSNARTELESLFGQKIYLDLWVKVKKGWRDNISILRNFGYVIDKS